MLGPARDGNMDTPGVFVMSSRAGEHIAQALSKLLAENGLPGVQVGRAEPGSAGDGQINTPRRLAMRHDFGIRVVLARDLGSTAGTRSARDSVVYDVGVMSGALGTGRGVLLLVGLDGVEPDLGGGFAGLVVDQVSLDSAGDLEKQLGPYARLLAGRILELETSAGFVMRPSTGLAVGYFKNFLAPLLEALRSRRAVVTGGPVGLDPKGGAADPASVRLVVCLPDDPQRVTQGAWASLARRIGLAQAEIGPISQSGALRTFGVWADGRGSIYDAPATLATAADIVRRLVAEEGDRLPAQAVALHNFGRTLRLLLREAEHVWMQPRVDIVPWSELEKRAG
jgi:hypothetical protein